MICRGSTLWNRKRKHYLTELDIKNRWPDYTYFHFIFFCMGHEISHRFVDGWCQYHYTLKISTQNLIRILIMCDIKFNRYVWFHFSDFLSFYQMMISLIPNITSLCQLANFKLLLCLHLGACLLQFVNWFQIISTNLSHNKKAFLLHWKMHNKTFFIVKTNKVQNNEWENNAA